LGSGRESASAFAEKKGPKNGRCEEWGALEENGSEKLESVRHSPYLWAYLLQPFPPFHCGAFWIDGVNHATLFAGEI
jgi:hypothetical protein